MKKVLLLFTILFFSTNLVAEEIIMKCKHYRYKFISDASGVSIYGANIKRDKKNLIFFMSDKKKIYFDLTKYIHSSLRIIKIKQVDILKIDTFDIKNKFFSARRALKLKHNDYGRNISIIMLN